MRSRELQLDARVGRMLFLGWAVATVACTLARRGELLEMAVAGVAGAVSWRLIRGTRVTVTTGALLALCFLAPLLNTWPLRVYDSARANTSAPVWALTGVPSLLVLAAALFHRSWRRRVHPLFLAGAALTVLAALTSSAASDQPLSAAATAWISLVVPAVFGLLVAQTVDDAAGVTRYVGVAVTAAGVPTAVGLATYLLEFGFPTTGAALVAVKVALYRPFVFQNATFGNVDHFGDFALVLLPPAIAVAIARVPVAVRVAAAMVSVGLAGVLVLVLSRSALAVGAAATVVFALVLVARRRDSRVVLPAVVSAMLIGVSLTPAVRHSFGGLVTGTTAQAATGSASSQPAPSSSEEMRLGAVSTGLHIFERNAPWGIGSGQYLRYDPIHTAPHSLAVQLLAENGVLGAAALAVFVAFLLLRGVALAVARRPSPQLLLRLGCVAGALALVSEGVIAGVALSVGPVVVWGLLLWLLAGLVAVHQGEDG